MRMYEITDTEPVLNPLMEHKVPPILFSTLHAGKSMLNSTLSPQSNKPAAGIACAPKRNLNVMECEIGTLPGK